jgi:flavin reductase (DIM6/NTAB) family NADH-FMN oxidoreductase RutF
LADETALESAVVVKCKVKFPPVVMPVCLVGANVEGRANFEAIAWFTFLESEPLMVGVVSDRRHFTNRGIRENKCFSVNVPSACLVEAVDYCGLVSGSKVDKSKVFSLFYGELEDAPMVSECPVCLECRLVRTVKLDRNELLVGEVANVYVEESCLAGGKKRGDVGKVDPLLYEGGVPAYYWKLSGQVAEAFEVGKKYKPKQNK